MYLLVLIRIFVRIFIFIHINIYSIILLSSTPTNPIPCTTPPLSSDAPCTCKLPLQPLTRSVAWDIRHERALLNRSAQTRWEYFPYNPFSNQLSRASVITMFAPVGESKLPATCAIQLCGLFTSSLALGRRSDLVR